MLNPWTLKVNHNFADKVELILTNQDTKESKSLNLDIDKINNLIENENIKIKPRDYQEKAALRIIALASLSDKDTFVNIPVGSGRTVIMAEIVKRIISAKETVLVLSPLLQIHDQTKRAFKDCGVSFGDFLVKPTMKYRCILSVYDYTAKNIESYYPRFGKPDYVICNDLNVSCKLFPDSKVIIIK